MEVKTDASNCINYLDQYANLLQDITDSAPFGGGKTNKLLAHFDFTIFKEYLYTLDLIESAGYELYLSYYYEI